MRVAARAVTMAVGMIVIMPPMIVYMIVIVRGDPQRHPQPLRKKAQADRHDQRARNEA
jgi:hypothetical protein